jgi:hypothetical protein
MPREIDDDALYTAIRGDVPNRRLAPWPTPTQRGRLIDAYALLDAVRARTQDPELTIEDLDHAVRRVHGHRLNYPLSRAVRALLRAARRSPRPAARRPDYFIDIYSWHRTRRRRHRR